MNKVVAILISLLGFQTAFAQIEEDPKTFSAWVEITSPTQELRNSLVGINGPSPTHLLADYTCTLKYELPNDPLIGVYAYVSGSAVWESDPQIPFLVYAQTVGTSVAAGQYSAGVFLARCRAQFQVTTLLGTSTFEVVCENNCLAFGGPFTTVVPLPADLSVPNNWLTDGGVSGAPHYLQYFGHPFDYFNWRAGDQKPRARATVTMLSQAGCVNAEWTSTGVTVRPQYVNTLPQILVAADNEFINMPLICNLSGDFEDISGDTHHFVGIDCTEGHSLVVNPNEDAIILTNKFSAHLPKGANYSRNYPYQAVRPPGKNWYAGEKVIINLVDQAGVGMPKIWVNEHFPITPPSWFAINNESMYWTTIQDNEYANDGFGVVGDYHGFDFLWYTNSNYQNSFSTIHKYYAATKRVDAPPGSGVLVGTFQILFTPPTSGNIGTVDHIKQ